jgi:hypothetical protein
MAAIGDIRPNPGLNQQDVRTLEKIKRLYVPLSRAISLVCTAVSLFFLIYAPSLITFTIAAFMGLATREVFVVGSNVISIFNDPVRNERCSHDEFYGMDEVTKTAPMIGFVLRMIQGFRL